MHTHLERPGAGPGADVEDVLGVGEGGEGDAAAVEFADHVVLEELAVDLGGIIGIEVGCWSAYFNLSINLPIYI